jgi:hypothetical protein
MIIGLNIHLCYNNVNNRIWRYDMKNFLALLPILIVRVLIVLAATLSIVAGLLYFKHTFTFAIYSDWLFITSILYIVFGIIPAYSVITSSNDLSIKYGEYMTKGSIDARDRVIDSYKTFGSVFPIVMVIAGLLCMVSAALVNLMP